MLVCHHHRWRMPGTARSRRCCEARTCLLRCRRLRWPNLPPLRFPCNVRSIGRTMECGIVGIRPTIQAVYWDAHTYVICRELRVLRMRCQHSRVDTAPVRSTSTAHLYGRRYRGWVGGGIFSTCCQRCSRAGHYVLPCAVDMRRVGPGPKTRHRCHRGVRLLLLLLLILLLLLLILLILLLILPFLCCQAVL